MTFIQQKQQTNTLECYRFWCAMWLLDTQHLKFIYKYRNSSPWNIASLNIFVRVLIVFCDLFYSVNKNEIFSKNATNLFDGMTGKTASGTEREKRRYGRMTFVTNWFRQKHLRRNARILIKWYCEYWVCRMPYSAAQRLNELRVY